MKYKVTITADFELSDSPSKKEVLDELAKEIVECGTSPLRESDNVKVEWEKMHE